MLFNSYIYIFAFLPVTLIGYFFLNQKKSSNIAKWWLLCMSLVFYGHYKKGHIPIIIGSIIFNYLIGFFLTKTHRGPHIKKILLFTGIMGNVALLSYFKYFDFVIENINYCFKTHFSLMSLLLPLGISFFTFTQIIYLVDAYKGKITNHDFVNYGLFITFFPHLLAGPILHHKQMIDQFNDENNKQINYQNIAIGLLLFTLGLAKKLLIADTFATYANTGFAAPSSLSFLESWTTSLSYTLQLYFDFSGYSDMALGSSLMFNVALPINFNSPYKATTIQDFWRRWHITLSNFLRDYIYIPLGGSRVNELATCRNLIITFLVGGFWHGAGWTFFFWGLLHGIGLVIQRVWQKTSIIIPNLLAWFITFNFVNIGWVFFRAPDFDTALTMLTGMIGFHGFFPSSSLITIILIIIFLAVCFLAKNSQQLTENFKPTVGSSIVVALLLTCSVLCLRSYSEFLYFRF